MQCHLWTVYGVCHVFGRMGVYRCDGRDYSAMGMPACDLNLDFWIFFYMQYCFIRKGMLPAFLTEQNAIFSISSLSLGPPFNHPHPNHPLIQVQSS